MAEILRVPFVDSSMPELSVQYGESIGIYGESATGKSEFIRGIFRLKKGVKYREMARLTATERALFQTEIAYFDGELETRTKDTVADFVSPLAAKIFVGTSEIVDVLQIPRADLNESVAKVGEYTRAKLALLQALAKGAKLLIIDDVFGLRPAFKKGLVALLKKVGKEMDTAYLAASTDLGFLVALTSRIAVVDGGALVELNASKAIATAPVHPYTRWLVNSHNMKKEIGTTFIRTEKDARVKKGCRFAHFCPVSSEVCVEKTPPATEKGTGIYLCHNAK